MTRRRRCGALVGLLACLAIAPAAAQDRVGTLAADYIGCLTEELLDEMTRALVRGDLGHAEALREVCAPVGGLRYALIELSGLGKARVRVHLEQGSLVLWVPVEATMR